MSRRLRVVVNAIPAAVPVTGIGRYVLELYAAIEALAGGELEILYYDGRSLSPRPPRGPADVRGLSSSSAITDAYTQPGRSLSVNLRFEL